MAVLTGRGSAKSTSLRTAGVRRWLAVDPVMPPVAVLVCGGLGGAPSDSSFLAFLDLFHRTLGLYWGQLLSKSLFPSIFWGAGGPPCSAHMF